MVRINLSLRKSIQDNADFYFSSAKKAKAKLPKVQETILRFEKELERALREEEKKERKLAEEEKEKRDAASENTEKKWYEKFRWFFTSDGLLCVGGRDASSNEIVVKKHAEKGDLVFHTDAPGSPFFALKTNGAVPGENSIQESADAAAIFSQGWKGGVPSMEVFYVSPEQLSKTAPSGEYITRGAFIVSGRKTILHAEMRAAAGINNGGKMMCGPRTAVESNCKASVRIAQGREKPSETAKKIRSILGKGGIDEIIRVLPSGGCRVEKVQITQTRRSAPSQQ